MSLWNVRIFHDLDVMAINKIYSKGTTFEDTIKQILIDNKREDIEFLYDPYNTATLTEDYSVEDTTIWDSIQKLALSKDGVCTLDMIEQK